MSAFKLSAGGKSITDKATATYECGVVDADGAWGQINKNCATGEVYGYARREGDVPALAAKYPRVLRWHVVPPVLARNTREDFDPEFIAMTKLPTSDRSD